MPRAALIQNAFTYGMWSPRLFGRNDLDRYRSALARCVNFVVLTQGGATRRPGSRWLGSTKIQNKRARFIPFIFSESQAYQVEVGDHYMRFWVGDGQLINAGTPVEIVSPYAEADLAAIQFVQSADTMYLVHQKYKPQVLKRTGPTAWSIADIAFTAPPAEWVANNYPGAIAFFEERLWLAGTPAQPQTLWASKSGDFLNFTMGTNDDDALKYTLASDTVNAIMSLSPGKQLAVFTDGGEFTLGAGTNGGPVTPTSVTIVRESAYGSARVQPLRIESIAVFVQRLQHKLREFAYVFEQDSYKSLDLLLLAENLGYPSIVDMAYTLDPVAAIWAVRSDGMLLSMSYDRDGQVYAWCEQPIADAGFVESVSVIPGAVRDEVWLIVRRTVGGATKRYVERVDDYFVSFMGKTKADAFFVDAGLTYAGAPVTEVSGLGHLEGKTVDILADGGVLPSQVVAGGKITLTQDVTGVPHGSGYSKVSTGLGFKSLIQTLPIDAPMPDGTAQGRIKRIFALIVRFFDTLGGQIGVSEDDLDPLPMRDDTDRMDASPPLFSGDYPMGLDADYERPGQFMIVQDQPLPMTILSVVARVQFND